MNDFDIGAEPSYGGIASALKQKLQGEQLESRRRLLGAVGARGLRTSGAGMLPTLEAERNYGQQLAGTYAGLGSQRLQNVFQEQESEKDRLLQLKLQSMKQVQEADMARQQKRAGIQSMLWSIPMNIFTSGASSYLQGEFPQEQTMNIKYQ